MFCGLRQFYKLRNSPRNALGLNNALAVIKGSLLLHALGLPALTGILLHISCPGKLIIYHYQGRWRRVVWLESLKIHRICYKVNNYSAVFWVPLQIPFPDSTKSPYKNTKVKYLTATSQYLRCIQNSSTKHEANVISVENWFGKLIQPDKTF